MDGGADQCVAALPVKCGDRLNHSTLVQGRADVWRAYSETQRLESGRETIYAMDTPDVCVVIARLRNMTTDLDLMLMGVCDPMQTAMASSTPLDISNEESVSWTSLAGGRVYLVVDGYAGAAGNYTLEVDCTCS
jgi:hypothetical protein